MKRFLLIILCFAISQTLLVANSADTFAAKPTGVCETFTKNAKIITHNGQHQVRDFDNLVQLSAKAVDGNTIIATGKSGNEFKVRFVASSAPAINEKGGTEAANFVKEQIKNAGGKVVMFHDGDQTDKNDRRLQLRLVCVVNSQNELVCLDELLVRNSLANVANGDFSSKPYFKQIKPKNKTDASNAAKGDLSNKSKPPKKPDTNNDDVIADLFAKQRSDVQVTGSGVVTKLLADDNDGSRHQRFILKLASGQTLLVAHNIDIAPRIAGLAVGDAVEFYGEYVYNTQGGIIHWTHSDPAGKHIGGWLKWNKKTYD
jgi:endonuclease YncB( thermonuclease family)